MTIPADTSINYLRTTCTCCGQWPCFRQTETSQALTWFPPNPNKFMENKNATLIKLLKVEIECLRSVLSEWDEDKSHFTQMNRADAMQEAIEILENNL